MSAALAWDSEDDQQSYLLLGVGAATFGLPALLVRRVVDASALVAVPLAPAFVLGAANVAGRVVCVVDLGELLRIEDPRPRPVWAVVDLPDGQLALAVPRIWQSAPGTQFERADELFARDALVERTLRAGDEIFRVLQLRALYDDMMSRMR